MPELSDALFQKMTRIDGARFRGHLLPSSGVNTREKAPYRVLHVKLPTFLNAGDVVKTYNGEVLILMEHPDDFPWALSFKGAYAKTLLTWKRLVTTSHPVARVPQQAAPQNMGSIYVNFDSPEDLQLEGISDVGYRFITGAAIQAGDQVGGIPHHQGDEVPGGVCCLRFVSYWLKPRKTFPWRSWRMR